MWKDFRNNTPDNMGSTLDHEKPQAVSNYAEEAAFVEDRTVSPLTVDVDYARHPSLDEPVIIQEKRERRGDSLWYVFIQVRTIKCRFLLFTRRVLSERHINVSTYVTTMAAKVYLFNDIDDCIFWSYWKWYVF